MSYRPTISLYINRHIADIGYYRNWDDRSLFYEAMTIAMLYGDCKSIEEYRDRKYGRQKIYISIEPEVWENTEENLLELEQCSEFPIIVDATAKCIYSSDKGVLGWKDIAKIPSILAKEGDYGHVTEYKLDDDAEADYDEYGHLRLAYKKIEIPVRFDYIWKKTDFGLMMGHSRIPFGHINSEEFMDLLLAWDEAGYHLSKGTVEQIRKRRGEDAI